MPAKDWSKIWKLYKGKWVALQEDEVTVITSADTLKETLEEARRKGFQNPIVTKMPSRIGTFIGIF